MVHLTVIQLISDVNANESVEDIIFGQNKTTKSGVYMWMSDITSPINS